MSEELRNIEDEKGQMDLGVFGYRVFKGAISEGASFFEAAAVVAAFFEGTTKGNKPTDNETERGQ